MSYSPESPEFKTLQARIICSEDENLWFQPFWMYSDTSTH